jgi:hypothetical protein
MVKQELKIKINWYYFLIMAIPGIAPYTMLYNYFINHISPIDTALQIAMSIIK